MSTTSASAQPERKRGPGRPKKQSQVIDANHQGIVSVPVTLQSLAEVACVDAKIFPKVAKLFKSYKITEIEITFDAAGMYMYATNHDESADIHVTFDGNCLSRYWCRPSESYTMVIQREHLHEACADINDSCVCVTILYSETAPHNLTFVMQETGYNSKDSNSLLVTPREPSQRHAIRDDIKNYPLKFEWDHKHFKRRCDPPTKYERMTVYFDPERELRVDYGSSAIATMITTSQYSINSGPNKLNLASKSEFVTATLGLSSIRPFTSVNISDSPITIYVDSAQRMVFTSYAVKKQTQKGELWLCSIHISCETVSPAGGQ